MKIETLFASCSSVAFQHEVQNLVGSLPQLLHHKVPLCHHYIITVTSGMSLLCHGMLLLHHCYITVTSLLHHCYITVHHGYITVTSLLYHRLILQDQVVASLKKYLLVKNSLSYEPLLE